MQGPPLKTTQDRRRTRNIIITRIIIVTIIMIIITIIIITIIMKAE